MPHDRSSLVALVRRIMEADYENESAHDAALAELEAAFPAADMTELIYWPPPELGDDPTAEEIVDLALTFRATSMPPGPAPH